jgi:hypothetical protein
MPNEENHPQLRGQKNLPHPFVLIPPAPRPKKKQSVAEKPNLNEDFAENHFSRGDCFDFSILLLGKAAAFWAQVAVAVRLFEQNGLGELRKPFALREAFAHDASGQKIKIFDTETKRISSRFVAPVRLDWLAGLRSAALENEFNGSLLIHFETPARIRIDDQIETNIPLSVFLKKLTERLEHLARVHAAAPEKLDYREFIADAEDSIDSKNYVRLYKYTQKSERQEKWLARDAAFADIILQGENIQKFLPLLTAGEILQIGADTSHGFGRYLLTDVTQNGARTLLSAGFLKKNLTV